MNDSLIMEVKGYLHGELLRLEKELVTKEEECRNVEHLENLLFSSRLERILKPFLKWFLSQRVKKLGREIKDLVEQIENYTQAEAGLERHEYGLAILLLGKLADRLFLLATPILAGPGLWVSTPNLISFYIKDLGEELKVRMRGNYF